MSITVDIRGQKEGQLMKIMASYVGEGGKARDEIVTKEDMENLEESVENLEESVESLKQEKAKSKSAFTRARKQLLELVEETDLPSRSQVRDCQVKLDTAQERALKIMVGLSEHYQWQKNGKARQKITQEMERLVQEFKEAHNRAQEYLDERKESETSTTAGSYHLQEHQKVSLGTPNVKQEAYLPFHEVRLDSSHFCNNSERQEEEQRKSVSAGGVERRTHFPMNPAEHSE